MLPQVGQPAPSFSQLDALRGEWVLLYFYPKDNTPGCTKEACSFRDSFSELKQRGVTILGVSGDSVTSHEKFKQQHQLPFELVADTDRQVINAYGADGALLPKRISYLIDPSGTIVKIYNPVRAATHAADVLADLPEVQQ